MILAQRYRDLTQPLTIFGKTYPAVIGGELTIDNLKMYALECIQSGIPALVNVGFEVNRNLFTANYSLTNNI